MSKVDAVNAAYLHRQENLNRCSLHAIKMPRNKEALIRYRIINRLLIEKKSATIGEMREACERALDRAPLGLRTIAGDISDMRSDDRLGYHAPIHTC